jgi:tryptophan synthase alpha chain
MTTRIDRRMAKLKTEGRPALVTYFMGGDPDYATSLSIMKALPKAGSDIIELGVPFSDPMADGATVQATSQKALDQGTTLGDCFELARQARAKGIETPILLMGYANPFYQYGPERLAEKLAEVGIDGIIIPDLPTEESEEFQGPLRAHGRDLIFLLAPTSTERRIEEVAERATGFIYCVSLRGVTGARSILSPELPAYIKRVRERTKTPLAIGFGISTPEHVAQAASLADGVVVASALLNRLDELPLDQQTTGAAEFIKPLAAATTRAIEQTTGGDR